MDDMYARRNKALEAVGLVENFPVDLRPVAYGYVLMGGATSQPAPGGILVREGPVAEIDQSFAEFLNMLSPEPATNPQRFAVVAYYLQVLGEEEATTQEDLVRLFREVGWRRPGNFLRDMRSAVGGKNAVLMPASDSKNGPQTWRLTRTGRQFVEARIQQAA